MTSLKTFIITFAIGCLVGWFFTKVRKKRTFGHQWGAMITGVIGAYIGHVLLGKLTPALLIPWFDTNPLPPLIGAVLFVWVLTKVSP